MTTTENGVPAQVVEEKKPEETSPVAAEPTENNTTTAVAEPTAEEATQGSDATKENGTIEAAPAQTTQEDGEATPAVVPADGETPAAEEKKEEAAPPPEPEPHVVEAEELFKKLSESEDCNSLLKKYLTQAVFDKVKTRKTSLGGTLADCIRSGVENVDSTVGVYACDAEAYKIFSELLEPIVKSYHKLPEKKTVNQPKLDLGDPDKVNFEDLDPDGKFILSTKLRVSRSQSGFSFPSVLNKEPREQLETKSVEAIGNLGEGLKGTYHKYAEIDADTQKALQDGGLYFDNSDRFLKSAGGYADWPEHRGIFTSEDKSLTIWVNEEDHLRIFSTQTGGDVGAAYKRLVRALKSLAEKLTFVRDDKLGYLTACPSNVGTTLHATVNISVPCIAETASDRLKVVCEKFNLEATAVEGSAPEAGEFQLTNKRRVGLTELQAFTEVFNGLKEIVRIEKELAWRPENVEQMFEHVSKAKACKSLLKKYLTKDTFEKLKEKKTSLEATLGDCIISGTLNLDSPVGVYAADAGSYTEFAPLFDPIIKDVHKFKAADTIAQPASEYGDLENLGFTTVEEGEGSIVVATKVEVIRSLTEFTFSPALKTETRAQLEQKCVEVVNGLDGELKGSYHTLEGLSEELQQELAKQNIIFSNTDKLLKAAGSYSDWPANRGVFVSEDKTFVVCVNGEDHVRISVTQTGADVAATYKKLVSALKSVEEKLTFARDERLGFLTTNPANLGTGLRASVLVKIPHLSARKNFKSSIDNLKLRRVAVENASEENAGLYEISNRRTLGLTEIDAVKELVTGAQEIVRLEKEAATSKPKSCAIL